MYYVAPLLLLLVELAHGRVLFQFFLIYIVNLIMLLFTSTAAHGVKAIQSIIFFGLLIDVFCMTFGCC